jgi:hypothetical protein
MYGGYGLVAAQQRGDSGGFVERLQLREIK